MDREAYFDLEKPLPPFESGDYVQYITQSNFIVQYRILQKQALEFEEVDEDGNAINEAETKNEGETEQSAPIAEGETEQSAPASESTNENATDKETTQEE